MPPSFEVMHFFLSRETAIFFNWHILVVEITDRLTDSLRRPLVLIQGSEACVTLCSVTKFSLGKCLVVISKNVQIIWAACFQSPKLGDQGLHRWNYYLAMTSYTLKISLRVMTTAPTYIICVK